MFLYTFPDSKIFSYNIIESIYLTNKKSVLFNQPKLTIYGSKEIKKLDHVDLVLIRREILGWKSS